jgi:hypothetical protein
MAFIVDVEKVKQKIAFIQDKLRGEANLQLLDEYRRLFKKEISFFRRPWVAAYLLMLHDQGQNRHNSRWEQGEGPRGEVPRTKARGPAQNENSRGFRRDSGGDRRNQDGLAETAYGTGPLGRFVLTEEESKRLFISIGRNRRLFPREILGLIINAAQVEREDIGSIRILDSYSFVQVRDTVADKIIEALNGTMFRGRTLAVNYAHTRQEGDVKTEDRAGGPAPETGEEAGFTEPGAPDLGLDTEQDDDSPDQEGV